MGKRIEAELIERGLERSVLYDLVSGLEDGTLSAIIKRDSKSSKFAPAIAEALNVELHWLLTGQGIKFRGKPQPLLLAPPDPVLADLSALEPEQAEMWKDRLDEALARVKRIKSEIRAAAKAHQQQERDHSAAKHGDDPPEKGRRRTA